VHGDEIETSRDAARQLGEHDYFFFHVKKTDSAGETATLSKR